MALKDYVGKTALAQFLNNLRNTFSPIVHEHTTVEITDLQDVVATDDGEGNVTFLRSSSTEDNFTNMGNNINTHIADKNNPHNVTADQIRLTYAHVTNALGYTPPTQDSKPKKNTVILWSSSWVSNPEGYYSQEVSIDGVTINSIIELQPDAAVLYQLINDKTSSLQINNIDGVPTAIAIGEAPTINLTIQCTVTEVE